MFRCKECGIEYDLKPDFCDCGNDTFDEILIKKDSVEEASKNIFVPKKEEVEIKKPEPEPKVSFSEKYPEISRMKEFFDPISTTIFVICLILSGLVIIFLWNPKPVEQKPVKNVEKVDIQTNIEDIWDDTAAEPTEEIKEEIIEEKPVVQEEPQQQVVVQPKKIINQKLQPAKVVTKSAPVKNNTTVSKPTPKAVSKPIQTQKSVTKSNSQDLINYKTFLRNDIASKIDFASVAGDGSCTITFKIDNSGKLIGRKFYKQSENLTLNEAVYSAMIATPSFKTPPASYGGQSLYLKINIENGHFEVNLY